MIRRHSLLMFMLFASFLPIAVAADAQENTWEKDIAAFEKQDAALKPPEDAVLFLGSSSIRMWTTLAADMAPIPVINRGFGGSQIIDSIVFAPRIVFPYKPRAIVFYAGDNDIAANKTPGEVFADFQRFVETVRGALPQTPIYYISIKPSPSRWAIWPAMQTANRLIAHECARDPLLYYLDCASPMLNSDGSPRNEIFLDDMLHMNAAGYRLWTEVVKEALQGMER